MDFNLSQEQTLFRDSVLGFARQHLADGALKRAHSDEYPWDVAKLMAKQGLLGIAIPEADGGQGGTLMDAVIAIQAVASVCPRSADVVQAGNFGAIRVLAEFGQPESRRELLPRMLAGETLVSVAMTEPEAGSAVTDLKTSVTPDGSGWRLNGTKVFTTHGRHASHYVVYCRFSLGIEGIGCVLVARDAPGVSLGHPSRFMSGENWAQIYFENVLVPPGGVILCAGGFKKQMSAFNIERIGNSARALALGRYAFDAARRYAMERRQFGRPLCEFQGLQWKFADMTMEIDAAQLLLWRAASNAEAGHPSAADTAVAKAYCNRAGFNAAMEAMQVMGGLGFSEDMLVEYCLRRTRGWMIAGGSIEMMKNRIAEHVFERRFSQRRGRQE